MDRKILEALRGKPDGVEIGTFDRTCATTSGWAVGICTISAVNGEILVDSGANSTFSAFTIYSYTPVIPGSRLLISWMARKGTLTTLKYSVRDHTNTVDIIPATTYQSGWNIIEVQVPSNCSNIYFYPIRDPGVAGTMYFSNISIQRLAPAVCTVMHEAYMGVGSGDLVNNTIVPCLSCTSSSTNVLYTKRPSDGSATSVVSYDNFGIANLSLTWSANEIHRRYVQTNATGTKFRVGYERFNSGMTPITNGIVWSHASAEVGSTFDGSFGPLTWLRFGLNLTVPIWHRKCWIDYKCLSDTEIQYRNKLVGN